MRCLRLAMRVAAFWAVLHAEPREAPELRAVRLVDRPNLHVGVRPAAAWGDGAGLTVQVTSDWP